ncbi:MAG: DNA mismatch repair endonuclease MutL [Candidatus Rifleibacteriota bacterium]
MSTGNIKVLSEEVISRIAAGEVVERPASVVKELIENAIDAQATRIEVEIKDGGQKLIEVSDNGNGMCRQDALLAFTPHATSKISDDADIEAVASLGFRGEALPTIASVSRVIMVTRHNSEETATRVHLDGGKISKVEADSFPQGTRIQVRNLFYNVPARRKFLKSVQAEMAQISDIVCHYMMGYPEIAFKFSKGNIQIASTSGSGNLADSILSVYGPEVTRNLLELKEPAKLTGTGVSIRGFISPPNQSRPSSRYMTTLVNRRYVKTRLLSQAINKAISAFFPKRKYPVLILDLRVPPHMIDVNVHPQKTEIRFKDERWAFATMWETIQASLSGLRMVSAPVDQSGKITELQTSNLPGQTDEETFKQNNTHQSNQNFPENVSIFPSSEVTQQPPPSEQASDNKIYELKDFNSERLGPSSRLTSAGFEPVTTLKEPKILAQLKNSYLLGEDKEGLFIVDQHAAHERILFDQLVNTYKDQSITSQPLLFPIPLDLLPSERIIIKENLTELEKLGFSISLEEDGQFYATAVPVPDKRSSEEESIQQVLSQILEGWESHSIQEIKIDLLKVMACKGAVKAGDDLDESEWVSLLEQMLKTENPFTCPHGRPVVIRITTRQIEAGFLRT